MNQYWRARAASSPAPGRPRDPRSRTARSRMRASSAPRRGRLCVLTRPWALVLVLAIAVETIEQFGKPVRNPLVHHIVVHGAKLLAEPGLHLAAELCWFGIGFLFACGRGFHRFLLSHWFAFIHCQTPIPFAQAGRRSPFRVHAKPMNWQMVP